MSDKIDVGSITKFTGQNYHQWMFQLKCALKAKGLYGLVDGTMEKPAATQAAGLDSWYRKDAQAMFLITSAMDFEQITLIENCETSKAMKEKLDSIYCQKSEVNKLMAHEKFHQYRMDPNDSVAKHVAKIENLAQQIKDCGDSVSETAIVTKILNTLPQKYRNVRQAWLSMDERKQTVKNLTARLQDEEQSLTILEEEQEALATMTLNTKKKSTPNAAKKKRFPFKCFSCHKRGHMSKDCYVLKQSNQTKYSESTRRNETALNTEIEELNITQCDDIWILDSGASAHMSYRRDYFSEFKVLESPSYVYLGNSKSLEVKGKGTVKIQKLIDGHWFDSYIQDVLFIPDLRKNLISEGVLTNRNMKIIKEGTYAKIYQGGDLVASALQQKTNNLYKMLIRTVCNNTEATVTEQVRESIEIWHKRLGHINKQYLKDMVQRNLVKGVTMSNIDNFQCEACILGKQHRKSFPKSTRVNKSAPGKLVYSDICGPIATSSVSGARYMLLFKDSCTGYRVAYFIKHKSDTLECFVRYNNVIKTKFGHSVNALHVDNGSEYTNKELEMYMMKEGIELETTAPYTPEQNGRCERENRTIMESVRTMLISANAPHYLWAEAANTAIYILNRTPSKQCESTPYEQWTGEKPYLGHVKTFGCVAYVHTPNQKRTKLQPKSQRMVFVGYDKNSTNYRLYNPQNRKITISCNVMFQEEKNGFMNKQEEIPVLIEFTDDNFENPISDIQPEDNFQPYEEIEPNEENRRPRRNVKFPEKLRDFEVELNLVELEVPNTYEEAIHCENADKWIEAIQEEIRALEQNKVWIIQKLPEGRKAIGSKWVFKLKYNNQGEIERYKARLCAKGFAQKEGRDYHEIFSPTTRFDSIRVILSVAAHEGYKIKQFDVKTAFLYGELSEEVYMEIPEGFPKHGNEVCKLVKSLYGLKQAPRCWNQKFDSALRKFGFEQCQADKCIYRGYVQEHKVLLIIYVDDGLLISPSDKALDIFLTELGKCFEIKVGDINNYVGLEIIENKERNSIFLHQTRYINKIVNKFGMNQCNPSVTPADPNADLMRIETDINFEGPYRECVGSLMFAAIVSRPDIAYSVGVASRFLNNPTVAQWNAVKRIIRYLKNTANYGIEYLRQPEYNLNGFCDADYASDKETRRSTTGYVFKASGGPITWSSKRQSGVTLSTTEAEYVAACQATKEAVWLRQLLNNIGVSLKGATPLHIDNQGAIKLIHNPEFHSRTKHVDVQFHFVREKYYSGEISPKYVPTKEQEADFFTKALPKEAFLRLRYLLGMKTHSD